MKRNFAGACLTLLLLSGCSANDEIQELSLAREARRNWVRLGIKDYSYEMKIFCECASVPHIRVVVNGNTVLSAVHVSTGAPAVAGNLFPPHGLDGLFDFIIAELRNRPAHVSLEFHPEYQFPTRFLLDPSEQMADDEFAYVVSQFKIGTE